MIIMKKFIAIFIVLTLMMSIMPAASFADDADTTPPEWPAGYPKASRICDTRFSLLIRSNEGGKVYFVRLPDGAPAPDAAQVKEGKDGVGNKLAYPVASSISIIANAEYSINVRGLMPNTPYDIYTVLEDSAGNLQPTASLIEVTTTVPDPSKTVISQTMMAQGTKQVKLDITLKNAAGLESPGYSAADFSAKVDGSVKTFAEPPFSGFNDPDTGAYTVYFTGEVHGKTYEFTELSVCGYIIKSDTVMVTTPPAIPNVCAIDAVEYATLDEALAVVGTGETKTIRLLTDITYPKGIVIDDRTIIFDLDGHALAVSNPGGTGLDVQNGGQVSYTGAGSFNVSGTGYGVKVIGENSSAVVNSVTAVCNDSAGVYADSAGQVTVNGNINVTAGVDGGNIKGAYAYGENSRIVVYGSVSVEGDNSWGIHARNSGTIEVNTQTGDSIIVTGFASKASEAYNATVTVNGSISASGGFACGAVSSNSAKSTVSDITISGEEAVGLDVYDNGECTVNGNINTTGDSSMGVYAHKSEVAGGRATVNGSVDAEGNNSKGVVIKNYSGNSSTVTINGSVEAVSVGVDTKYGHVTVTGDVKSHTDFGASVRDSDVTIDGKIDAPSYLDLSSGSRTEESYDSIDEQGYWIYNGDDGSVVKVGNKTNVLPTVTTFQVLASDITSTGVLLRGSVTSEGSSPVTEYGFIYNDGVDHVMNSTGPAASFTVDLAGRLTPGTTYSARAFAKNSVGTAYGQTVSFTTTAIDPPGMPVNRRYLAHDGAMELFWEPGGDGGSPILYYEILSGGNLTVPWTNVGNVTSYMATGLENGIYYTFSVRAVNAAGPGEAGMINGRPNVPTVPGPPRELRAQNSSRQVKVTWREPWSNGYRDITGYQVSSDGTNWVDADYSDAHTFTGLTNGAVYTFYVRAVNVIGAGEAASIEGRPMSSGGGYSPGTPSAPPAATVIKAEILDSEGGVSKTVTATHDIGTGTVAAEVDSASLTGAFGASEANDEGITSIEIVMPKVNEAKAYEITLPADAFSTEALSGTVEIRTGFANVTLPDNMLPEDLSSGAGKITLTVAAGDPGLLADDVREQIGNKPVIELKLAIDGRQVSWSNENAPVTVAIPYTPTEDELANPGSIIIWYIDGNGNAICVPNGQYDSGTGTVVFTTTHFSYYVVGYNKVRFRDVPETAWYYDAVSFIAARDIPAVTDDAAFGPNVRLTRGDYLVMLMRAYEISPDTDPKDNFSDAGNSYYTGYLAAAKRLGISAGIGNNMYAPEKEITRQEMFTLLYNALKVINRLPKGNSGKMLADFSDADQVSPWAKEAMTLLTETGIIIGSGGKLTPGNSMTRAEMAQVLYRLLGGQA